jgi:hypothetical protein
MKKKTNRNGSMGIITGVIAAVLGIIYAVYNEGKHAAGEKYEGYLQGRIHTKDEMEDLINKTNSIRSRELIINRITSKATSNQTGEYIPVEEKINIMSMRKDLDGAPNPIAKVGSLMTYLDKAKILYHRGNIDKLDYEIIVNEVMVQLNSLRTEVPMNGEIVEAIRLLESDLKESRKEIA